MAASTRERQANPSPELIGWQGLRIEQGLEQVEEALRLACRSSVGLLSQSGEYVIGAGGKRIRPRLVLLAFAAGGGEDCARAVPLATAMELLHTASLIHDDINDESNMRRGRPSLNHKLGDKLALLVGDFVFVRLLGLMGHMQPRAIGILAEACTAIVEGETRQMLSRGNPDLSEQDYLEIVAEKTAALLAACARLGGIAADADEAQLQALGDYGFNVGMAFQIRDDALDVVGQSCQLGKPVANDLDQRKMSLATLFALGQSANAREILLDGNRQQVQALLLETGAIEYAMLRAKDYVARAKNALGSLPESVARTELADLADFAVARYR